MSNKIKKLIKEEYNRLKKGFDRLLKPDHHRQMPQPALQPIRNRKFVYVHPFFIHIEY
jgi:hypothetical protein